MRLQLDIDKPFPRSEFNVVRLGFDARPTTSGQWVLTDDECRLLALVIEAGVRQLPDLSLEVVIKEYADDESHT